MADILESQPGFVIGRLETSRFEGASVIAGGYAFAFVSPRNSGRMLFTLAHELVANLQRCRLWVSPLVVGECEPTCAAEIAELQNDGRIHFVPIDQISAEQFLQMLDEHGLGEGETECIALCSTHPYSFCCDDNRARQVAAHEIGNDRLLGSLRLLKWCVEEGLATPADAFDFYNAMRGAGGFLPEVELEYFVADD